MADVTPGDADPLSPQIPGWVTVDDVRMYLVDKTAEDNFLLDALEFSDEEIQKAMSLAVDRYNMLPPLLQILKKENMPHYLLIVGTTAMLLKMKAFNYMRNRLDFSQKNGTAVQDKNKGPEYLSLSKECMEEFLTISKQLKIGQNIESCYGHLGSPYRWFGFY